MKALSTTLFFAPPQRHLDDRIIIFELPPMMPTDFCFGGGHDVTFKMVDWFAPHSDMEIDEGLETFMNEDLREKSYFREDRTYLAVTKSGRGALRSPLHVG